MEPSPDNPDQAYPHTDLGLYLHELPLQLRLEREKLYRDNLVRFEDKTLDVIEKTVKYLLAMNGGGLAAISAVAGAFYKEVDDATRLLPAGIFFVAGLIFCGLPLMNAGRYLVAEYSASWNDTVAMFSSKMRLEHAGYKMVHRRSNPEGRQFPSLLASFYCFILGAVATVVGVMWPQFFHIVSNFSETMWECLRVLLSPAWR